MTAPYQDSTRSIHGARALLLWDVAGTILSEDPHGGDLYVRAAANVLGPGRAFSEPTRIGGMTDHAVVLGLLEGAGFDTSDALTLVDPVINEVDRLIRLQATQRELPWSVLPGVQSLMNACTEEFDAVHALVTGSSLCRASSRLGAFGLDALVDLRVSAFGNTPQPREELVRTAIQRFRLLQDGQADRLATVVLIGDTPRDVAAARSNRIRSIGVATGSFTRDELVDASPDLVVTDLQQGAEMVLAVIRSA